MSSRLNWDQPEGHKESKGLFTRCALHPKHDLFLGKEPGPSLKFHPKAGLWREAPYTTRRPNSAPALALGSGREHPGPRRRSLSRPQSGPVQAPPWYSVSAGRGKPEFSALFTKTKSSSLFGHVRSRYIPTLIRQGQITSSLEAVPPRFLFLVPSLPLL